MNVIYSADEVRRLAKERDTTTLSISSQNIMCPHSEVVGVAAELMFACTYGLPMNQLPKGTPDPGYDFEINGCFIDCKASTKPFRLLIPVGKGRSGNIYVNYYVNPDTLFAMPLGWEYGYIMAQCPVKDFGKGPAHWKWSNELKHMLDLHKIIFKIIPPAPCAFPALVIC